MSSKALRWPWQLPSTTPRTRSHCWRRRWWRGRTAPDRARIQLLGSGRRLLRRGPSRRYEQPRFVSWLPLVLLSSLGRRWLVATPSTIPPFTSSWKWLSRRRKSWSALRPLPRLSGDGKKRKRKKLPRGGRALCSLLSVAGPDAWLFGGRARR